MQADERPNRDISPLSPLRVLLVGEGLAAAETLREELSGAGCDAVWLPTAELAMARVAQDPPDVVLADLPAAAGGGIGAELAALPAGLRVPLLLALPAGDDDGPLRALDSGAADFVHLPATRTELVTRIRLARRAGRLAGNLSLGWARLSAAQRLAGIACWTWEPEEEAMALAPEGRDVLGLPPGRAGGDLLAWVPEGDREDLVGAIRRAVDGGRGLRRRQRIVPPGKQARVLEIVGGTTPGTGGRVDLVGTAQDITERVAAEQRIYRLAYYDGLTGLPNRSFLEPHLSRVIAQCSRHRRPMALLILDLDMFKRINDTLGHAAGDDLLKEVSNRFQGCLRAGDMLGRGATPDDVNGGGAVVRLGGDEFVVVLSELRRPEDAAVVARRLADSLKEAIHVAGADVFVGTSIGIACYPENGEDAGTLLKNADAALYHAKELGRGQFFFYTPEINQSARARLALENDLRRALEGGELQVHYQPKIESAGGGLAGAEALVRWQRAGQGWISPGVFIPIAEESGLVLELGRFVLRRACEEARSLRAHGLSDLTIAVNISARQLREEGLVAGIASTLHEVGLPPSCLEVEITEGLLMEDTRQANRLLGALRELGVTVALDDFGTGYSSLGYLKDYPIDKLKIDRSFVKDMLQRESAAAIVRGILALCDALGITVVAEGVETAEQAAFLRAHGCHELQGFLYSRAVPAPDLLAWALARPVAGALTPAAAAPARR